MGTIPSLYLGATLPLDGEGHSRRYHLPAHHLSTHGVVVGMTGSGKTGLLTVMVEEALRARVPVLVVDVKGDLPNLLLAFPSFDPAQLLPWASCSRAPGDERSPASVALQLAEQRRDGLVAWGLGEAEVSAFDSSIDIRVLTPGSSAGELLHMLSSMERRSTHWDSDVESARTSLCAAVSLVLRLVGRDPDPAASREHVLLSLLAERRLLAGGTADLAGLLQDLETPPIDRVGALPVDRFLPKKQRQALAAALNALLASPSFASWRQGTTLDVADWMSTERERPSAVVVSVAHLDDDERALVLGVLLEEVLSWVRSQPGSRRLRALIVFDEVFGFLPPHPANPPTKRPLVSLMKQARAFGVGVVLATQNPMDLDYRALGNAGLWCVGKLQTDADRERIVDGLASLDGDAELSKRMGDRIKNLSQRWFVVRDARAADGPFLLQPRWAMSHLRGPMTRSELRAAIEARRARRSGTRTRSDGS